MSLPPKCLPVVRRILSKLGNTLALVVGIESRQTFLWVPERLINTFLVYVVIHHTIIASCWAEAVVANTIPRSCQVDYHSFSNLTRSRFLFLRATSRFYGSLRDPEYCTVQYNGCTNMYCTVLRMGLFFLLYTEN